MTTNPAAANDPSSAALRGEDHDARNPNLPSDAPSDEHRTVLVDIPKSMFPSRFPLWNALTVFSIVSLIALTTETDVSQWQAEEKWILCVTVFSILASAAACLAYIFGRPGFEGMPLEGLLLFTELGLWVGGMIVMMDTENMLALDGAGRIMNANLYFFGWAGLATTVILLVGYGCQVNPILNSHVAYWTGLGVASVVTLASSIQILVNGVTLDGEEFDCQGSSGFSHGPGYCQRLKFSTSLGAISTFVAGLCIFCPTKLSDGAAASVSVVMFIAWAAGVALITFGDKSPGNGVGNLYFSCWAAFVFSLFMVSASSKPFLEPKRGEGDADKQMTPAEPASEEDKGNQVESADGGGTASPTEALTPTSNSKGETLAAAPTDEQDDPTVPAHGIEASYEKV